MITTQEKINKRTLVISSGEPAGIGPDLIIQNYDYLSQEHENTHFLVLADPDLLQQRSKQLGKKIDINRVNFSEIQSSLKNNSLNVLPIFCVEPVIAGLLNIHNSSYVMKMLDTAIELCQTKITQAMVTCPIQKSVLLDAGYQLQGHTEYLAQQCKVDKVVMMLANPMLRVALVTTHIPLKDVSSFITQKDICETISILHHDLKNQFSIPNPKIYVCGLNPHAGESGHLGHEEIETIIPALTTLRNKGIDVIGPLPADTIFSKSNREVADAFVAMYHDQGLPVLKALGFGDSINITLGLPIIRTSVDHGTALDLAGTGNISISSFSHALETAKHLSQKQLAQKQLTQKQLAQAQLLNEHQDA